ncbi:MAG: hypothetical protein QXF09_06125 [Nitrososphaerota archaeon]
MVIMEGREGKIHNKSFNYGIGAIAILAISIGFLAIIYGGGFVYFDPLNLPAWIFGPLGIYTIIYSLIIKKDILYYSIWGIIMFAIAIASALYNIVNVFIVFGILLIVITIVGIIAYLRRKI